jgi:hypothetical protein
MNDTGLLIETTRAPPAIKGCPSWREVGFTVAAERLSCLQHRGRTLIRLPSRRLEVLNRYDRPSPMAGEAEVKYLDGDFRIIRPGAFVRCAVTGTPIPLEELKYWSVDLQEPYATPDAVMRRLHPGRT